MTDYTLTKDDCQRLLREYPELKAAYELLVKIDFFDDEEMEIDEANSQFMSNEEFWQEFLEKNLTFQTEPFRGNNPIFIPRVTEDKDYEDKYVHN